MTQQTEAQRLAEFLDSQFGLSIAAAELRRLEAVNKQLLEALNDLAAWNDGEVGGHMDEPYAAEVARAAIAAAKGEA